MPLVLRFYFPFRCCYGGRSRGNSLQFNRLQIYGAVWQCLPCVSNCWRGKKKMFSMDLWKQKHRFVLFEVCHSFSDNSMFSGALGGPSFLQIRLVPGESGKFVSRTFSSTLCLPPILCSLCNAHLQWSQCPMGLTTDYPREGSNLGLIDSN